MDCQSMFEQQSDEVTTMYFDGCLQVIVNHQLSKQQIKAFNYGAGRIAGVKGCEKDDCAAFSSENTCFLITFKPDYASKTEPVRSALRTFAEKFLTEMQPENAQASLF